MTPVLMVELLPVVESVVVVSSVTVPPPGSIDCRACQTRRKSGSGLAATCAGSASASTMTLLVLPGSGP